MPLFINLVNSNTIFFFAFSITHLILFCKIRSWRLQRTLRRSDSVRHTTWWIKNHWHNLTSGSRKIAGQFRQGSTQHPPSPKKRHKVAYAINVLWKCSLENSNFTSTREHFKELRELWKIYFKTIDSLFKKKLHVQYLIIFVGLFERSKRLVNQGRITIPLIHPILRNEVLKIEIDSVKIIFLDSLKFVLYPISSICCISQIRFWEVGFKNPKQIMLESSD